MVAKIKANIAIQTLKRLIFLLFVEQKSLHFIEFLKPSVSKFPPRGGRAACGGGGYAF